MKRHLPQWLQDRVYRRPHLRVCLPASPCLDVGGSPGRHCVCTRLLPLHKLRLIRIRYSIHSTTTDGGEPVGDFPHFNVILAIGRGTLACRIYVEKEEMPDIFVAATIGGYRENKSHVEEAYWRNALVQRWPPNNYSVRLWGEVR